MKRRKGREELTQLSHFDTSLESTTSSNGLQEATIYYLYRREILQYAASPSLFPPTFSSRMVSHSSLRLRTQSKDSSGKSEADNLYLQTAKLQRDVYFVLFESPSVQLSRPSTPRRTPWSDHRIFSALSISLSHLPTKTNYPSKPLPHLSTISQTRSTSLRAFRRPTPFRKRNRFESSPRTSQVDSSTIRRSPFGETTRQR